MTSAHRKRSHKQSRELPQNARLIKQELPRPLPPHRLSAEPKTVYVSTKTPFMSAVKRVRKALTVFKDQSQISVASGGRQRRAFQRRQQPGGLPTVSAIVDNKKKYVTIKATGKAIEKALELGLYFQGQKDTTIEIRTGTLEATDDVRVDQSHLTFEDLMNAKEEFEKTLRDPKEGQDEDAMDVDGDTVQGVDPFEEIDDVFPSRTRNTSVIEIIVRSKAPT